MIRTLFWSWVLNKFLLFIISGWQLFLPNTNKTVSKLPSNKGWIVSISSICNLIEDLLQYDDAIFVRTRSFTQDSLENLFSQIRRDKGGCRSHPSANQTKRTFN